MNAKILTTVVIMVTALIVSAGYLIVSHDRKTAPNEEKVMLVMRNIGHELLLLAGDSTSRVLPVTKLTKSMYQIDFENGLMRFNHDSLFKVVHANFSAHHLPMNYMLNVRECKSLEIAYGYQFGETKNTLVPCKGRSDPPGCYIIQIAFQEKPVQPIKWGYWATATVMILAFIGFTGRKHLLDFTTTLKTSPTAGPIGTNVGGFKFDTKKGVLWRAGLQTQLSDKEADILNILVRHCNELVERDLLLKEVWEDNGVITGRSLDVYVSRLRKKLQADPSVKIVNVHGRGYRLFVAGNVDIAVGEEHQ
jgi:DNA-binding winged helix-turn-helix (wHTH) protein